MFAARFNIKLFVCSTLAASVLALVGAPALARPPASSAQTCAGASATVDQASRQAMLRATLCLLNQERSSRGLHGLRMNDELSLAARRHAEDMVEREYFDHDSRSGTSFVQRIKRTGYLRSAGLWLVGENLAWGEGNRSTPASIMRAWMRSPGHRGNILNRRFREIGVGVVSGAPEDVEMASATYATEFGLRR